MTRKENTNEIISQITAFSEETYSRAELLPELLKLQDEIVGLTFGTEQTEHRLLCEVEKYWEELNAERGCIANKELDKFKQTNKIICNNIRALISGDRGEQMISGNLAELKCQNGVLQNVELEFDGMRTEIDALVFTNRAIFIIEIKNGKKDIYINEDCELYRIGQNMYYEGNIADKMDQREQILRRILSRAGYDYLKIFRIMTFANSHKDVECKYRYIKVCPGDYLDHFIERFTSDQWHSYDDITNMMNAVNEARRCETYKIPFNVEGFKKNFAEMKYRLEEAVEEKCEQEPECSETQQCDKAKEIEHNEILKENKPGIGKIVAASIGLTILNIAAYKFGRSLKK